MIDSVPLICSALYYGIIRLQISSYSSFVYNAGIYPSVNKLFILSKNLSSFMSESYNINDTPVLDKPAVLYILFKSSSNYCTL